MTDGRAALRERLGHAFRDPSLLEDALTHRSARGPHNERLEFLGDAFLNFVIAGSLYDAHPDLPEGDLTRLRAALVRAETLAEIARELELDEQVILGPGAATGAGHRRGSILGDALEAVIGAVFVDAGFEPARKVVLGLYRSRLDDLPDPDSLKDPKTRLQERLQARQLGLPRYSLAGATGAHHERRFIANCSVEALGMEAEGEGRSRRAAEQAAAERMLARIEGDGDES